MIAVLGSVVLLAAPHYPLATVFVRNGQLWLSELGQAQERRLETPGLISDAATLDVTGTRVAFTAHRGEEQNRIFLMELRSESIEELATGLVGPHHSPAFSGDGKRLFFTASPSVNPGPEQPTKIRVWNVVDQKLEDRPALEGPQSKACEFHPAPRKADILHVSTDCFGSFALSAAPMPDAPGRRTTSWRGPKLSNPEIEIAASFDGSRIVYTSHGPAGLSLVLQKGVSPPKVVATLPASTTTVQPRFVCPRDVMFLRDGKAFVLNTDTEELKDAALAKATPAKEKH